MEITFFLPYRPQAEETILIVGSHPDLGMGNATHGLAMDYDRERGLWQATIHVGYGDGKALTYAYAIRQRNGEDLIEEGGDRRFFTPANFSGFQNVVLWDYWKPPKEDQAIFNTAPFRNIYFKQREVLRQNVAPSRESNSLNVHIRVAAPCVPSGSCLYMGGAGHLFGDWDLQKTVPMVPGPYPFWEADIPQDSVVSSLPYKYALGHADRKEIAWEPGDNRFFPILTSGHYTGQNAVNLTDWPFRNPQGPWKGTGIAIPVFSLRSEKSLGVGEFTDIKPLVDWAKAIGCRLIQILPVNDTSVYGTWYDSYPYSIISAHALHPIYLNLDAMAAPESTLARGIAEEARRLNASATLDYEAIMSVKMTFLKRLFREDASKVLDTTVFQAFLRDQAHWLKPYAAFCHLRDQFGTSDYRRWDGYSCGTLETIAHLTSPEADHYPAIAFHYYIQFHLHQQLADASAYAREQGICLKGDIPIGVAKEGVETWQHPELFHMDQSTGAPPDFFSSEGQNWGFPTYNWPAMTNRHYDWWQKRLCHLSRYFDAVRLDHVIGFFRIWTIPDDAVTALRGRFDPARPFTRRELEALGIEDIDGLCIPHFGDGVLNQLFGKAADAVIETYLDPVASGGYRLKPNFATQRQIAAHIERSVDKEKRKLQQGLFALVDDVLLLPDHQLRDDRFHPRIFPERTFRFQTLPIETKQALQRLHEDYFFIRHEDFWPAGAKTKLSALASASSMMLCGEDLGLVPQCLPDLLESLYILALRIQRMPVGLGKIFGNPAGYPYLSVATPGSHDMLTIREWWETEDRAMIQVFYQDCLGQKGIAPKICEPWICREIIRLHLMSTSMWAIIPVQDLLGMDETLRRPDAASERINDPATPHHNWNYRLHMTLEDLLAKKSFTDGIRRMIEEAGRIST